MHRRRRRRRRRRAVVCRRRRRRLFTIFVSLIRASLLTCVNRKLKMNATYVCL